MSFPTLLVEADFATASTATSLVLDDATRGKLDTGTLESSEWVDITQFVRRIATRRGRNRFTDRWGAGALTMSLDNRDRRFDPTNDLSPYWLAGRTRVEPMRAIRVQAIWNSVTYPIFYGFVDSWNLEYTLDGDAVAVVAATDAFKVFAGYDLPEQVYSGTQTTGARIGELLTLVDWSTTNRDIDTGDTTITKRTFTGPVLDEILATVQTEIGGWWVSRSGTPTFRGRQSRWERASSLVPQVLFGENWGDFLKESVTNTVLTKIGSATQTFEGLVLTGGRYEADTNASPNPSGDWEMVARVKATNWATGSVQRIVTKGRSATANEFSFAVTGTGALRFTSAANSSTVRSFTSSVNAPFTNNVAYWVKATVTINNGTNSVVRFYWAIDQKNEPIGWNELGVAQTSTPITWPGTGNTYKVALGAFETTGDTPLTGTIERVILRSGIGGTKVFDVDAIPELPYVSITLPSTDDLLVNRVSAQRTGGTVQTVSDAVSASRYLPRANTYTDLLHLTDTESKDYAGLLVGLFNQPDVRFEELGVNAQGDDRLWPAVLGREIADKVTIRRRPVGGGAVIERDCWIEGVSHDITANRNWIIKFQLSDASTKQVATTDVAICDVSLAAY